MVISNVWAMKTLPSNGTTHINIYISGFCSKHKLLVIPPPNEVSLGLGHGLCSHYYHCLKQDCLWTFLSFEPWSSTVLMYASCLLSCCPSPQHCLSSVLIAFTYLSPFIYRCFEGLIIIFIFIFSLFSLSITLLHWIMQTPGCAPYLFSLLFCLHTTLLIHSLSWPFSSPSPLP